MSVCSRITHAMMDSNLEIQKKNACLSFAWQTTRKSCLCCTTHFTGTPYMNAIFSPTQKWLTLFVFLSNFPSSLFLQQNPVRVSSFETWALFRASQRSSEAVSATSRVDRSHEYNALRLCLYTNNLSSLRSDYGGLCAGHFMNDTGLPLLGFSA